MPSYLSTRIRGPRAAAPSTLCPKAPGRKQGGAARSGVLQREASGVSEESEEEGSHPGCTPFQPAVTQLPKRIRPGSDLGPVAV